MPHAIDFSRLSVFEAELVSNAIRASREALFEAHRAVGTSDPALEVLDAMLDETHDRRSALLDAVEQMTPSTEVERAALIGIVTDYAPSARPDLLDRLIAA